MPKPGTSTYNGPKLYLAFLWHQHQPYYKNLFTGEYILPWVRLHGIKDYLDMVEILDSFPGIRQIFNFVPSLLEQLDDYAQGRALDPHLAVSRKPAAELSQADKSQAIELLFQAHYDTMIGPYRRYAQLFRDKGKAAESWNSDDWRDLQVLSNLSWIDPMFKKSGRLKSLVEKGERYTDDDKMFVLESQIEIIRRIVPSLKSHMESGQIEVSVTPYFHPIMPLVYDTSSAHVAMPGCALPKERFRHPEDVDRQVADAVKLYESSFGRKPVGMWPSEGSVSEDIIPILVKNGIQWIATDEEILAESLGIPSRSNDPNSLISSGQLYRGYLFTKDGAAINLFFRDHALSDNIGFVYSGWDPEAAANDFLGKLGAVHRNIIERNIPAPIVPVILDGENAWEYYSNDGHDFLSALYTKIQESSWLETITFDQYLEKKPPQAQLSKLFAGSWISHNFAVWIGHSEDNKAWDLLSRTRNDLVEFEKNNPGYDKEKLALAWKEVFIGEGSDWCWWFGDDHVGPNNDDFDRLFRAHLSSVYSLTDREPPAELLSPIRSQFIEAHLLPPVDQIKPLIDGKVSNYYEWKQAGYFDCAKAGSTMHKAERLINGIWFGYDNSNLYFRIDPSVTVDTKRFSGFQFELELFDTDKVEIEIKAKDQVINVNSKVSNQVEYAIADFLELSAPLDLFPKRPETIILARLTIREDGKLLEVWPPTEALKIEFPNPNDIHWFV
jgi:alpha-amylase/alpha-mannosidase (GH57 family)